MVGPVWLEGVAPGAHGHRGRLRVLYESVLLVLVLLVCFGHGARVGEHGFQVARQCHGCDGEKEKRDGGGGRCDAHPGEQQCVYGYVYGVEDEQVGQGDAADAAGIRGDAPGLRLGHVVASRRPQRRAGQVEAPKNYLESFITFVLRSNSLCHT